MSCSLHVLTLHFVNDDDDDDDEIYISQSVPNFFFISFLIVL